MRLDVRPPYPVTVAQVCIGRIPEMLQSLDLVDTGECVLVLRGERPGKILVTTSHFLFSQKQQLFMQQGELHRAAAVSRKNIRLISRKLQCLRRLKMSCPLHTPEGKMEQVHSFL